MRIGSVDPHVANRAVRGSRFVLSVEAWHSRCKFGLKDLRVTLKAELSYLIALQHLCVRRTVCVVAGSTPFDRYRKVFINKRPLFVGMTLYAHRVSTDCQPRILDLESAVAVVTVATVHLAFKNLVMERLAKLRFGLLMAAETKLRFTCL